MIPLKRHRKEDKMNISVILAHPDQSSFNHAIAAAAMEVLALNEHAVCFHDLYQEKFDPLLPAAEIPMDVQLPAEVKKHCIEIAKADGIVIVRAHVHC